MKQYLPHIVVAVAAILIYRTLFSPVEIKTNVDEYLNLIHQLEQKVDSLHTENITLETEADSLESKIKEYDKTIQKLNTRIYVIKKNTKKQLDAVDRFGDDELEKFFADRYEQYKDSID